MVQEREICTGLLYDFHSYLQLFEQPQHCTGLQVGHAVIPPQVLALEPMAQQTLSNPEPHSGSFPGVSYQVCKMWDFEMNVPFVSKNIVLVSSDLLLIVGKK